MRYDLPSELKRVMQEVFGSGADISAANPLETHDPTIEDVEGKVDAIKAVTDVLPDGGALTTIQADLDNPDQYKADLTTLETRLSAARALLLDEITALRMAELDAGNIPADIDTLKTYCDILDDATNGLANIKSLIDTLQASATTIEGYTDLIDDATNGLAAIKAEVEGLAGEAMRGTDGAALAANWTAALATALGNYTAAKAAFLDEAISAPKIPKSTDESGSFLWDTSAYTTVETDISALFDTALTGATRRKYSLYLDLTQAEADGAAWTKCTLKVKVKVDGANYRTVDKKEIAKTDVAAAEEPGVEIDIPPVAQDVQITMQFDVALGADATIYYHYVKGVLE